MLIEIKDDELAALAQKLRGGGEGLLRIGDMMQRLAENDDIDALGRDRRIGEIAEAILEIWDAFLFRLRPTESDHLGRIIDRNDLLRAACEQLREPALACA